MHFWCPPGATTKAKRQVWIQQQFPCNITAPTCPGTCCCRKAASPVPHLHGPSLAAIPESRQRAQTGIICSAVCWWKRHKGRNEFLFGFVRFFTLLGSAKAGRIQGTTLQCQGIQSPRNRRITDLSPELTLCSSPLPCEPGGRSASGARAPAEQTAEERWQPGAADHLLAECHCYCCCCWSPPHQKLRAAQSPVVLPPHPGHPGQW